MTMGRIWEGSNPVVQQKWSARGCRSPRFPIARGGGGRSAFTHL